MELRPHVLSWEEPGGDSTIDPETGYIIPGTPGQTVEVPCRWHQGGTKEFLNTDNTVVRQQGRISFDVGQPMPELGQFVKVTEGSHVHFAGTVKEVYRGQLRWRIDV